MAKTSKKRTVQRSGSRLNAGRRPAHGEARQRRPDVAAFFATKLEAEWGPFDLKHALDERSREIVVLDTRSPDAYEKEHIPQAINIPTAELEKRFSEIPPTKEVVPYCWNITCHLATHASLALARHGYRVHELVGGIDRWKGSDFPVETHEKEPALS